MNIKINNVDVQYSTEFRVDNPEIFKILSDPNHKVYLVDNGEYEDIIIFVSYRERMFETMLMSEFENYLRRLNKRLFFNILSLFNEIYEGLISKVEFITKDDLINTIRTNLKLKDINFIKKRDVFYIYFCPEDEIGEIIDVTEINKRKAFLENLKVFNIENNEIMLYDILKDSVILVNKNSGYITSLKLNDYPQLKANLPDMGKIIGEYDKIVFCDIRKAFKHFNPGFQHKEINYVIDNKVLYITYIKEFFRFNSLPEYSRYVFNNRNESLYDSIRDNLGAEKMFYVINQNMADFILYIDRLGLGKYKLLKDLNIDNDCTEIMESFPIEDIISLDDLNEKAVLSVDYVNYERFDEEYKYINNGEYLFWVDYFEKTLMFCKSKNM